MAKKIKNSWISGRVVRDVSERYQATLPDDGQLKGQCLTFAAELWIALPESVRKLLLADLISIDDVCRATSQAAYSVLADFTVQKTQSDFDADTKDKTSASAAKRGRSAG